MSPRSRLPGKSEDGDGEQHPRAPADLMMAQYSLPFCVALAHYKEPPRSGLVQHEELSTIRPDPRAGAARHHHGVGPKPRPRNGHTIASTVTRSTLKDGRVLTRRVDQLQRAHRSSRSASTRCGEEVSCCLTAATCDGPRPMAAACSSGLQKTWKTKTASTSSRSMLPRYTRPWTVKRAGLGAERKPVKRAKAR